MILAIDIGNTNITVGLYCDNQLKFVSRLATERKKMPDQYAVELLQIFRLYEIDCSDFEGAIISSVVPELTNTIKKAAQLTTKHAPLTVGPGIKTGLNIKIDNPAELGADLVAGAVGAIAKHPLPALVLDMGTATKISIIDKSGNYLGCTIAPGVRLSLDALSKGASQLSAISLDAPQSPIGTNTVASMQSGIVFGAAAMIDGMIERIEQALGDKVQSIVATGGISGHIVKHCSKEIILDENLVLDGLMHIFKKNEKQDK